MIKKICALTILSVVVLAGCAQTSTSTSDNNSSTEMQEIISESQAKEIALKHTGLDEASVYFVEVKLETENGVQIYDVDFYSADSEYDYEINAMTGDVINWDTDIENFTMSGPTSDSKDMISEEQAKEIIFTHAEIDSSMAMFTDVKVEEEEGIMVYKMEFIVENMEYEYEINAETGDIISWDKESKN